MPSEKPKLRRRPPIPERPPLLQLMPAGRVRIDPTIREAVATYLIAASVPWEREARASERGLTGAERDAFQKRREWYRTALKVVGAMLELLEGTVSVDAIDSARDAVRWALAGKDVAETATLPQHRGSPAVPSTSPKE